MADMDDYESLPEDASFTVTASAGALAGIAEHVALYPVDSVKVRFLQLARNTVKNWLEYIQFKF